MRLKNSLRAVSTLIMIILILCSVVFGAILSYLWVMASYYNMPENTTLLIVEDVFFNVSDARYFNVTVLNPSNSVSDVDITAFRLSAEGKNETYDVTNTEPSVYPTPFSLKRGTKETFKCKQNWSNFFNETVRIEPVAGNVSTKSHPYAVPAVGFKLTPIFDAYQSIEFFSLAVTNLAEDMDLTITEILFLGSSVSTDIELPYVLPDRDTRTFHCYWNWESYWGESVSITVKSAEGYESTYFTDELSSASLYIDKVEFDYTDAIYFNLTVTSSEFSTATALLNRVNLTLPDETTISLTTIPSLITPLSIPSNQSLTLRCLWSWNEYRNESVTISVSTVQGFTILNKTVVTPPSIVWNMTYLEFDLDDMEHFLLNVTNMPVSLAQINVTNVLLDGNETLLDPPYAVLTNGTQMTFNCTLPWGYLRGKNGTLTVQTEDGLTISENITIPSVGLKLLDEPVISELLVPYVNFTISNSNNSFQNVTITRIVFETENGTYEIDSTLTNPKLTPDGYILEIGEETVVFCPWNWALYLGFRLTVTVYTAEGFTVSETWYAPFAP